MHIKEMRKFKNYYFLSDLNTKIHVLDSVLEENIAQLMYQAKVLTIFENMLIPGDFAKLETRLLSSICQLYGDELNDKAKENFKKQHVGIKIFWEIISFGSPLSVSELVNLFHISALYYSAMKEKTVHVVYENEKLIDISFFSKLSLNSCSKINKTMVDVAVKTDLKSLNISIGGY